MLLNQRPRRAENVLGADHDSKPNGLSVTAIRIENGTLFRAIGLADSTFIIKRSTWRLGPKDKFLPARAGFFVRAEGKGVGQTVLGVSPSVELAL